MSNYSDDWKKDPPPIKKRVVMCGMTKCEDDLHSFKTNMRKKASRLKETYRNGNCVCCDKDIINWERIDKKDPDDINYLIKSLKKEEVRYRYWNMIIESDDVSKAQKKGLKQLRNEVTKRIEKSIGPSSDQIFQDGRQTPPNGNVIFYAQHATATCCRKCVEEWYGIRRTKPLKKQEKDYLATIMLKFITKKIPSLKEEGVSE